MTDNSPDTIEPEDDADMAAFLRKARSAVALGDPAPRDVTEFAKLAFQFRGYESVEAVDTSELAGVRSGAASSSLQASHLDTTIIWSSDANRLTGVIHSAKQVTLSLQTPEDTLATAVADDGTFEASAPISTYRLLIDDGDKWATTWVN